MTEKEYIANMLKNGKIVWKDDDEQIAQYFIDNGIRYSPNNHLALSKLENCILRAIMAIKSNEYDSAEECLMNAREILEGKEISERKEEN